MRGIFRFANLHAASTGVFQHFVALWGSMRARFCTFTCLKFDTNSFLLHPIDGQPGDQLLAVLVGLVDLGAVLWFVAASVLVHARLRLEVGQGPVPPCL